MSYDKYQYQILCEDRNHYNFVRGWLLEKGAKERKILLYDDLPHPGSGKEYVRGHFDNALRKLRSQAKYLKKVLIVVIDADNLTYEDVMRYDSFRGCSDSSDNVFFIVPRWSIETWARWLLEPAHTEALDELKSCKKGYKDAPFTKLGKQLAECMKKRNIDDMPDMPDSLHEAIAHVTKKLNEITTA